LSGVVAASEGVPRIHRTATFDRFEAWRLPSPAHIRSTVAAIVDQPDDLRELRIFHRALADVNRLRIVRRLAEGPATVSELIDTVGLSQPLVSWHVSRLKAAGVVETRRTGREVLCGLRPNVFDEVEGRERILLGVPATGFDVGTVSNAGSTMTVPIAAAGQSPTPRPVEVS
jgi:DNA-binding transcriptional ArsR family regulator